MNQAQRLAMLLQAIDDAEAERAEYMTEHKDRVMRLRNEASKLKREILTGQLTLVPDPEPPKEAA